MIAAIALDDEPLALEIVEAYCARSEDIKLERTFTKVQDAERYLRKFPVDLIFLDINMPSISGIEFMKKIEQHIMVIFTTAYSQYAVEGFNLNALDYILKPFSFDRFTQAVKKAVDYSNYLQQHDQHKLKFMYLKADYSLIKIALNEILYIESFADYLKVYLPNKKSVTTRMTMKAMSEKLPKQEFVRVHRSFILPVKHIESIRNRTIKIQDKEIPIGTSYMDDINAILNK